jgi:hypothetical protein
VAQPLPFTVYSTTVDTCTNNTTGVVYDQSSRQTTGNGLWQCYSSTSSTPSLDLNCNPTITQQVTHATSSTDYNRFYLRAWDANPALYCGTFTTMSRQDFWQCQGIACPSCPSGYLWNNSTHSCVKVSPIVVDISGKGFFLTDAQNGVLFDPGIGHPVQMAWTAKGADNAFLALPGADGLVHNGLQLFGNFTPQPVSDTPNGFAALAVYDDPKNGGNGDGVIDSRDAIFSSLRLWIDANHDGICQPGELHTLPSLGVNSLSLQYKESEKRDQFGNVFRYRALVDPDNPSAVPVGRTAYDVFFLTLSPVACTVPKTKGGMLSAGTGK